MLVSGIEILRKAHEGNYAVGAFNTNNLEFTKAIIEAAEEENSPVIIQTSQGAIKYAGIENIANIVITAAKNAKIPVALNLDHGSDFDVAMKCLRYGWTSIMFDASKLKFNENIAMTKKVVDIAHAMGVSVEGELGKIGGVEEHVSVDEREATMTDPDEALEFLQKTNIDYLAISVGTAHGVYKGEPKLSFDRIEKIKRLLNIPLVLHGASGVPEESIKKAVELGINKINIDTDLRLAFRDAIRDFMAKEPDVFDPRNILKPAIQAIKENVKAKIRMFGSSGKA